MRATPGAPEVDITLSSFLERNIPEKEKKFRTSELIAPDDVIVVVDFGTNGVMHELRNKE